MRPLTARPARTALPAAHFERNHMPATYETMHYNEYDDDSRISESGLNGVFNPARRGGPALDPPIANHRTTRGVADTFEKALL
jgi:hypothetical protein